MCVPGLASLAGGTVCKLIGIKDWVFHSRNFVRLEFFCEIHMLRRFWRNTSGVARYARVAQPKSVRCKCSFWAIPWRARHDAIRATVGGIWLKSAWGVPHRTVCFRHFQSFQDLQISRHAWGYLHPYRTGTASRWVLMGNHELVDTTYIS